MNIQIPILNDIMYVILAVIIFTGILILWHLNKDRSSPIDLIDLIAINGKLNERKITRFGAWIVSTWGFVYLIIDDKFTEWYFLGYMGAWVANALIGKALRDKDYEDVPPPPQYYARSYRHDAKPVPTYRDPVL